MKLIEMVVEPTLIFNHLIIDTGKRKVYYEHRAEDSKRGCYFNVNTPKTPASNRQVPMLDFVKEAF